MKRVVFASDFHLGPERPDEVAVFEEFTRRVVAGADRFYVLGDLFETWVGRRQLRVPECARVFDAMAALSRAGTQVFLFHGNRDFLLGAAEARACGGTIVGEEHRTELFGRRCLLLHGDSLCTDDVEYQKSKPFLRGPVIRFLSWSLPLWAARRVAGGMRKRSKQSTARKTVMTMGIVPAAARARFAEGFDAMVCGHVHDPGVREVGDAARPMQLHVLGDWHGGGVYAEMDERGLRLERFDPQGARSGG